MFARIGRAGRYITRLVIFSVVTFVLLIEIAGAYQGFQGPNEIFYPQRTVFCCDTPADAGFEYSDVALTTEDNLTLRGWYMPGENGAAMILAHGANGNRASMWEMATLFHQHGYGVLMFDMRAHGASDGTVFASGWLDILAAADYLTGQGITQIGAYGFSLGGTMVIQAAAKSDVIKAVAADGASPVTLSDSPSPRSMFGWLYISYDVAYWTRLEALAAPHGGFGRTSMREAVARIAPRPLLLIAAGAEFSRYEANAAEGFYQAAQEPKTLWVIDDVIHGGGYGKHPEEFERRIMEFFDAALLNQTTHVMQPA